MCYSEDHLIPNYPWRDRTKLKFCTKSGVGDHSLEYCPIMIDALNKIRNFNVLPCVPKNDAAITKNMQIITRQGMKIGGYYAHIEKIQRK